MTAYHEHGKGVRGRVPTRQRLLHALARGGWHTAAQIAQRIGRAPSSVGAQLRKLEAEGLVEARKPPAGGHSLEWRTLEGRR